MAHPLKTLLLTSFTFTKYGKDKFRSYLKSPLEHAINFADSILFVPSPKNSLGCVGLHI